jgi:PadR family transcriptional regulator, regulatory protein PadR
MRRKNHPSRVEILQGTLDLLIPHTLLPGPSHGHSIARHIQRTSEDRLQAEIGSLYPALHRLEAKGFVAASWELSDKGTQAKYYRLTASGCKQLASERSKWQEFSRAIGLILNPTDMEAQ